MHGASLWRFSHLRFESCVVLDGNQTHPCVKDTELTFESCVVLRKAKEVYAAIQVKRSGGNINERL